MFGGAILLITGSYLIGVVFRQPEIILIVSILFILSFLIYELLVHTGTQYSAAL